LNANQQSDSFTSLEMHRANSNHIPGGTIVPIPAALAPRGSLKGLSRPWLTTRKTWREALKYAWWMSAAGAVTVSDDEQRASSCRRKKRHVA
jgi:hypothetical protein